MRIYNLCNRGSDELCRRFYIFGQNITCVRWKGNCYISGPEIFKIQMALYRLNHKKSVPRPKRFEEIILTQLRSLKEGQDFILEDAGSEMIKFFHKLGAIRTHKRQKIFLWDSIKVLWFLSELRFYSFSMSAYMEPSQPRRIPKMILRAQR